MPSDDDKLTIVEGCVLPDVGVHPVTLSEATRRGELPFEWKSGRKLIRRGDLIAWAEKRKRRPRFVPAASSAPEPRSAA